jgi:hypothetical protein
MSINMKVAATAHMEAVQAGSILVRNGGGYVARFSLSYDYQGQEFSKDSGNFTLGVNKSIEIPSGATNLRLKVEEMWGFGWSTIFTETFADAVTKCYEVYGTTLQPKYKSIAC